MDTVCTQFEYFGKFFRIFVIFLSLTFQYLVIIMYNHNLHNITEIRNKCNIFLIFDYMYKSSLNSHLNSNNRTCAILALLKKIDEVYIQLSLITTYIINFFNIDLYYSSQVFVLSTTKEKVLKRFRFLLYVLCLYICIM